MCNISCHLKKRCWVQSQAAKERMEAAKNQHPMVSAGYMQCHREEATFVPYLSPGLVSALHSIRFKCDAERTQILMLMRLYKSWPLHLLLRASNTDIRVGVCTGPISPLAGPSHIGVGVAAAPGQQAHQPQRQRQRRTFKCLNSFSWSIPS